MDSALVSFFLSFFLLNMCFSYLNVFVRVYMHRHNYLRVQHVQTCTCGWSRAVGAGVTGNYELSNKGKEQWVHLGTELSLQLRRIIICL